MVINPFCVLDAQPDKWSAGNPYNKMKPKITGAKNKTISYGDTAYDVRKGIRAKNTTGFQAKKKVQVCIQYKEAGSSSYKKVKKVNTKKPGIYRITYQLKDAIGRKAKVTVKHRVLEKPEENGGGTVNPVTEPTPAPTPPVSTPGSETQVR